MELEAKDKIIIGFDQNHNLAYLIAYKFKDKRNALATLEEAKKLCHEAYMVNVFDFPSIMRSKANIKTSEERLNKTRKA